MAHPARSLLLGPRLTALVYPNAIVASGANHSELAVAHAARDALEIASQVSGVRLEPAAAEVRVESILVHASVPAVAEGVARDPLLFDRLGALFAADTVWEPELLPALVMHVAPRQGRPGASLVVTEAGAVTVGGCATVAQVGVALQVLKSRLVVASAQRARGGAWGLVSAALARK